MVWVDRHGSGPQWEQTRVLCGTAARSVILIKIVAAKNAACRYLEDFVEVDGSRFSVS